SGPAESYPYRWANQHDVRLGELDAVSSGALPVHVNTLVVVVNRYRQLLLGLFLADDVLVEEGLDLMGFRKLVRGSCRRGSSAVIFQNGVANCDTFVAM